VLIGSPFVPTQRRESLLGFDVEFHLHPGRYYYSLFLQHKVSEYIDNRTSRNWILYNFHGGPYYFYHLERLDKSQQHNLLYNLSQSGEEVYYSSPLFYERKILTHNFSNNSIINNCVFIDPKDIGYINDFRTHRISYIQNRNYAAFESEINRINIANYKQLSNKFKKIQIEEKYFYDLLLHLQNGLSKIFGAEFKLSEEYSNLSVISQCFHLLKKYYKLEWILFSNPNQEQIKDNEYG